jgi:hypothetical protein
MHPVLTGGRQPDQGRPVTQQGPQITDLLGAIQAPGNKISPQQLGQGGRIDLVVLQPGRGDGLAAAGVDQVRLQLLQQLDQPPPAIGGLEGDRGTRRKRAKDRHQLGRIVSDVAVVLLGAGVIHDGDLGALTMDVHPDIDIHQASSPELDWSRSQGGRAE